MSKFVRGFQGIPGGFKCFLGVFHRGPAILVAAKHVLRVPRTCQMGSTWSPGHPREPGRLHELLRMFQEVSRCFLGFLG